jgi:hypothetical protein
MTLQGHKKTKVEGSTKRIKIVMTLHHHPHSLLQKNLWCSSTESLLFLNSSVHASCRYPFWHGSIRWTGLVSTITIITLHPIRGATAITIILHPVGCIIDVSDRDNWGQGVYSRRRPDVLMSPNVVFNKIKEPHLFVYREILASQA